MKRKQKSGGQKFVEVIETFITDSGPKKFVSYRTIGLHKKIKNRKKFWALQLK